MHSTMQDDYQLTIGTILAHGSALYPDSTVITGTGSSRRQANFAALAESAALLAAALRKLGVRPGDRVATLCWNTQEHLEAYLAVPAMGAVLHTLNLRLSRDQLAWVINHAGDKVVIVEASLCGLLASIQRDLRTVEHVVVIGTSEAPLPGALDYDELLAAQSPGFEWPALDERTAAATCYTSGTTGDPKGVVYSHRSTYLHTMAVCLAGVFGLTEADRVLSVVPMFHANAWGLPYAAWLSGADLVLPGPNLAPEPLAALIAAERPTFSAGVPTVWADLARHLEERPGDLSSLRLIACGGSAVPRHLIEHYEQRHGVTMVQAWGMTETSPIAAVAHPPRHLRGESELDWRARTGRIIPGVELRVVDDALEIAPWDGASAGEIQVRGPWITGSYHDDPDPTRFHEGWLRTGDVGVVDPNGFVRITDRSKDVIKSGGEWISSVDLEAHLMAHPDVAEAAVIAVPDERWQERPLACVVRRPDSEVQPEALRRFLADRVPKWWVPERWTFIQAIPRTGVGKFDKKVLRAQHQAGELQVEQS